MSDVLIATTAIIYGLVAVSMFTAGTIDRCYWRYRGHRREGARMQLAALVWPLVLAWLGLKYSGRAGRAIGQTFALAISKEEGDQQ